MTAIGSRSLRLALLAAGVAGSLCGCAMSFDVRSLGVPATMSSPAGQPAVGDTFNVSQTAVHLFWGAYQVRAASLQNTLAGQLGNGRSVQDLRIRVHRRWSDVLATVLTAGLIVPSTVTLRGVVVGPAR